MTKPEIKEALEKFFEKFPLRLPNDIEMSQSDFLLLHLWLRGYEVVPINEPWEEDE